MNEPGTRRGLSLTPLVFEDRPQRLVEMLAVADKRPLQHAFLDGPDLPERTIAPRVVESRLCASSDRPPTAPNPFTYLANEAMTAPG